MKFERKIVKIRLKTDEMSIKMGHKCQLLKILKIFFERLKNKYDRYI